eukprot:TRINITY_DN112107_c0_g1_i1.p1 TRINITY_DN112107_c0_g1~~TRINITY_DN112107_c0_g1_i1.p1  ORF type:complete len:261 (-),score=41.09 TRINITY_DN112107_c0_g1_i1:7-789(-)
MESLVVLVAAFGLCAASPAPAVWPQRWVADEKTLIDSSRCDRRFSADFCFAKFIPGHHMGKYYYDFPGRRIRNDVVPVNWERHIINMSNILAAPTSSGDNHTMHMVEWNSGQCIFWIHPEGPPKPDWMLVDPKFAGTKDLTADSFPSPKRVDEWKILPGTIYDYTYDEDHIDHTPVRLVGPCVKFEDNVTCSQVWSNYAVWHDTLPDYLFDVRHLHCHEGPALSSWPRTPLEMKSLALQTAAAWGLWPSSHHGVPEEFMV